MRLIILIFLISGSYTFFTMSVNCWDASSCLQQQMVTFVHASSLLGSTYWREIVMAESCSEALSREIFLHTQSTADMSYRLDTLAKPCWSIMYGRRTIYLVNFIHLAPLMKQIKGLGGRLLWCVDLLTAYDRWLYTLLLCKHRQTDIGKPNAPKFRCTNTDYMRPRVSKELFISESEKLPLRHIVVAHN